MAEIFIDSSNPRLWLMRTSRQPGAEEFIGSVERAMAENPSQQKFALIIDMRKSERLSASSEARKQATDFIRKHEDWFAKAMVGVARVSPDPIVRGVLTVYDFFTPGRWPRKTFINGMLAEAWTREQLARAGVECAAEPVWRE